MTANNRRKPRPALNAGSAGQTAALLTTFGLDLPSETRLYLFFFIGLTVFGIFGSFTFYLPELFPTRLRSTGSGFCYNIGRVIALDIQGRPRGLSAHAVHDRLRPHHRAVAHALGHRDTRPEDARLKSRFTIRVDRRGSGRTTRPPDWS